MKIVRGGVNKMRIQEAGMKVAPARLNIIVEFCYRCGEPLPLARLRSGSTVVKVVIDNNRGMLSVSLRFVHRDKTAGPCIDDVVLKNIIRHVPLHLELARPCVRRVVVVERVVDYRAVLCVSPLRRITSYGNSRGMAVIDQVIARRDVTGGPVLVLTGQ